MPQLHPKVISEGLLFPLHIVVAAVRTDTLYSASKPHQIVLAASEWTEASPSGSKPTAFTARASLVTVQEVHLSDRLRLLHQRQASPLWTVVDRQKTQSDPRRSNYYTQMNPTTFPSCSGEATARLWQ